MLRRAAIPLLLFGPRLIPQPVWQRRERLQTEDLRSIQHWFQKKYPQISRFLAADKLPIDNTYSAMAVTGVDAAAFGVFIVYGKTNQVYMVLDLGEGILGHMPRLEPPTQEAVYVHWYGDYGFYGGSHKYVYNLSARVPAKRYVYRKFSVTSAWKKGGALHFLGAYDPALQPVPEKQVLLRYAQSGWSVREPVARPGEPSRFLTLSDGRRLHIPHLHIGEGHRQPPGIIVIDRQERFYPMPLPAMEDYRRLRPDRQPPVEMDNRIGPFALDGGRLWFATTFYDGEGSSGLGAVGAFDTAACEYEMRYLPEIAPWAGSAIYVDEEHVWVGLSRHPEGAVYGAGLLRFHKRTGAARVYPIPDLITAIERQENVLFFASSHGVYTLDTDSGVLNQIRIEPGSEGPREVVSCRQLFQEPFAK